MKKIIVIGFILLLFITPAYAKLRVGPVKEVYSLGEPISFDVFVLYDKDVSAILSTELICEEVKHTYFTTPIVLKEDKEVIVKIDEFIPDNRSTGFCIVDVYLHTLFGAEIEKSWTGDFRIEVEEIKEVEPIIEATPEVQTQEIPPEPVTIAQEIPDEIEQETDSNMGKYGFSLSLLFIFILIGYFYVYYRLKFRNRNRFNRGWRLPKR